MVEPEGETHPRDWRDSKLLRPDSSTSTPLMLTRWQRSLYPQDHRSPVPPVTTSPMCLQSPPTAKVCLQMTYADKLAARGLDPTRIDISVDPTQRRMSGVAVHGNTPFDVPFISEIEDGFWQGGCKNRLCLPHEIVHLVSLYPWEQYTAHEHLRSVLTVTMYDSLDQGLAQIDAIAAWVNEARKDGPTLVHCQAGLNRSGLVAARALMLAGRSADEAIALLREQRSPAVLCNPSFEAHLRSL